MVEEKNKAISSLTTALPVTALLAGLTALIFSNSLPYQNERPSIPPLKDSFSAYSQDVDARLWQDPFAAVDGVGKESLKEEVSFVAIQDKQFLQANFLKNATNPSSHNKDQIYIHPSFPKASHSSSNAEITILAVTLSGGPYQEDAEERRRRRYAVLSGLASQGYSPLDEQHIGYFQPDKGIILQKRIPFEWWFLPNTDKKVLLLWVDESSLFWNPAAKLKVLLEQATQDKSKNTFNYSVIGPNTSTLLQDMLNEVARDFGDHQPIDCDLSIGDNKAASSMLGAIATSRIEYYSAGATAADEFLLGGKKDKIVSKFFCDRGVKLYRTTATDRAMMDVLVHELGLRDISKSDHVVIISEWDTFYGRHMPDGFKNALRRQKIKDKKIDEKDVHFYGYMRGLDGILPDKGDKAGGVAAKKTDSKEKTGAEALIELPEGQSQKDYLRRLTHKILKLDQQLKKDPIKRKGIVAIGVLGSDVHDKLMILEALRQHFPHKLIFTTDLDVVYNHPAKWPQSHNLLVASAFDLQLRDELQGPIPPFRDSYQTAFFLATQLQLNNITGVETWKQHFLPRMFEIGRSRPVPLRTFEEISSNSYLHTTGQNKLLCSWEYVNWNNCNKTVHPEIPTTFQIETKPSDFEDSLEWVKAMSAWVVTIVFFVGVLPWVSWRCRDFIQRKKRGIALIWKSHPYKVLLPVGFVLHGFVVVLAFMPLQRVEKYFTEYDAEPFYWFQGVSAWPSILLRFLAGAIAIGAFFWGRNRIKKMQSDLQTHHDVNDEKILGFNLPEKGSERNTFLDGLFVWNFSIEEFEKQESGNKRNVLLDSLWKKYLDYWNQKKLVKASTWRAIFHGTVFIIVILPFIYWFDFPNAPMRGDTAFIWHKLSLFCAVIPTVFLIRWVVENARLCERLIEILSAKPSSWNKNALQWARHKNVAPGCEEEWLDIELVTHLTKTIQPLIYGPMVCIGLLAMARNSLIDDWDLPLWLFLVFVAMLLFTFTTEVSLQRGARVSRAKAIKHMTEKIRLQRNLKRPNETIITRIEVEIERIRALREGAFCPWYEWPWARSFGGLGALIAALKYIPVLMLGGALVE